MGAPADIDLLTRRFLQTRRRGPLDPSEVTRLLADDAEYVEIVDGRTLTITGARHIAELFRRLWAGLASGARMQVIRHVVVDDETAVGHWARTDGDVTIHGRDTLTVRDGVITRITVEEFSDVRIPELMGSVT